jgi:hypothetical protein
MRTTVTLDPDVAVLLTQAMRERGLPFKQALTEAVRRGLARQDHAVDPFRQRTFQLGRPRVDLTKALALAGELNDQRAQTLRHQ